MAAEATGTSDVPRILIAFNEGWSEADLSPAGTNASIAELIASLPEGPSRDEFRRTHEMYLRGAFERARQAGGVAFATFVASIDEAPHLLMANLLVVVQELTQPLAVEVAALAGKSDVTTFDWDFATTYRIVSVEETSLPGSDERIEVLSARYYQQIAESKLAAAVMFSTLNVTLHDDWLPLFDDLAESFEIEFPAAETPPS